MEEIRNAKITSVSLGYEDHGCLTCWLSLDYGSTCQAFGGYTIDQYNTDTQHREGSKWGCEFIKRVIDTVGVRSWESLNGQHIRVKIGACYIEAIGHIIEDKWFNPKIDLKYLETK